MFNISDNSLGEYDSISVLDFSKNTEETLHAVSLFELANPREIYHDLLLDDTFIEEEEDESANEVEHAQLHPSVSTWTFGLGLINEDDIDANDAEDICCFYQTPPESSSRMGLNFTDFPQLKAPRVSQEALFPVSVDIPQFSNPFTVKIDDLDLPELDRSEDESQSEEEIQELYDYDDGGSGGDDDDDDPEYVDAPLALKKKKKASRVKKVSLNNNKRVPPAYSNNKKGKLVKVALEASSSEANFKCSDCGKAFNRKSNHDSHIRVHLTVKPHSCSLCGRKFARNSDKKRHEKSHCKNVSLKCSGKQNGEIWGCGSEFNSRTAVKSHWESPDGVECLNGYIGNLKLVDGKTTEREQLSCFALLQLERQQKGGSKRG